MELLSEMERPTFFHSLNWIQQRQRIDDLICFFASLTVMALFNISVSCQLEAQEKERPNILWIFAEDTSPWMGCYGDPINSGKTPNIDSLANKGIRFSRAFVPAPVCSACRSALMAGQNQIRINAHEHRSSRGPVQIRLPDHIELLPQLLKKSGYFTFNAGKTDYNFQWNQDEVYSLLRNSRQDVPWSEIKNNQPFFGQIQTAGGKNNTIKFASNRKTDPSSVTVPAEYPQNPLYREVVAQHYDAIRKDDDFIGTILSHLEKNGLAKNTIVVYFSDHGANNLVRHKQMPTEGGLHVPFIICGPDPHVPASSVRDDLVNLLDLSATTLHWAGVEIPRWHEGQNLFAEKLVPRNEVFAAKDRLDHTIDRVRSVRSSRYRYTRNFKTDRILLQPQYRDSKNYVINLRQLYSSGQLSEPLKDIYFGERPAEEFYDVQADPSQLKNLATDPDHQKELERHRRLLEEWIAKGDAGITEEPLDELRYQANGHKWGEGVNPEYEIVRNDSDGDGLSDDWERINSRDPQDSRLMFLFNCGGWQTEGWTGQAKLGNICGYLGSLEFKLADGEGILRREHLNISGDHYPKAWTIRAKVSHKTNVQIDALLLDGTRLPMASTFIEAGNQQPITIACSPLNQAAGPLVGLELQLRAEPETRVEIDSLVAD